MYCSSVKLFRLIFAGSYRASCWKLKCSVHNYMVNKFCVGGWRMIYNTWYPTTKNASDSVLSAVINVQCDHISTNLPPGWASLQFSSSENYLTDCRALCNLATCYLSPKVVTTEVVIWDVSLTNGVTSYYRYRGCVYVTILLFSCCTRYSLTTQPVI